MSVSPVVGEMRLVSGKELLGDGECPAWSGSTRVGIVSVEGGGWLLLCVGAADTSGDDIVK
jgi:hypothetical protein